MKDLSGKRFHCLTVTDFAHVDGNNRAIWVCQCDCGKTTLASTNKLISGGKKSCGHLRREELNKKRTNGRNPCKFVQWADAFGWEIDIGLDELEAM